LLRLGLGKLAVNGRLATKRLHRDKCIKAIRLHGYGVFLLALAATLSATSESENSTSRVDLTGLVHAPSFDLPPSRYMSDEAKHAFMADLSQASAPVSFDWSKATIEQIRKMHDDAMAPDLERMKTLYPVTIVDRTIAGVRVREVTPARKIPAKNRHRILLNLHGGGFFEGANAEALVESIPIAVVARMRVITIDYRQAPEHHFPAASDDVVSVYRELLATRQAQAATVGIYGCSAGGILTAEVTAALQHEHLPRPGAIGIFSSGAYGDWNGDPLKKGVWGGDSRYWAGPVSGRPGLPSPFPTHSWFDNAYMDGVDLTDPLVSPAESSAYLAKFPSTLLMSGTRAYDLSAVVETHRQLIKSGVQADLHLWDGLGHCFFFDPDLPESQEAYAVIADFFNKNLRKGSMAAHLSYRPQGVDLPSRGHADTAGHAGRRPLPLYRR
jgi:monoterpene epsilon-lactone hydrolase